MVRASKAFIDPDAQRVWPVLAEWRQENAPGVMACTIYEVIGGPKRYARRWDALTNIEWGWVLHPSAQRVW